MATLFLVPAPLGDSPHYWLPEADRQSIQHLRHFVVEAEKTARKHLKALIPGVAVRDLALQTLNEHTPPEAVAALLTPLTRGEDLGLLSEAGCPAVADPGARLVALAHSTGHTVVPLIGPSSILLALMASGANWQCFCFHGYLPVDPQERAQAIRKLEQRSRQSKGSQIFIETPYRNQAMLTQLLQTLQPTTRMAVACDLTLPGQLIISQQVSAWPDTLPDLHKRPSIFVVQA